jgi:hypothetical protein
MTPGELAREVTSRQRDDRFHRLVWEWYYPRRYGAAQGALSDAEARELMEQMTAAAGAA